MPDLPSYGRLIAEHDEIGRLAETLDHAIGQSPETAHDALARLHDSLARHLETEDRMIHPRLMDGAHGPASDAARRAHDRYVALTTDWAAFVQRWTVPAIAADQTVFVAAASTLLDRLRSRIREEEELLYPAALQAGQIRLRD